MSTQLKELIRARLDPDSGLVVRDAQVDAPNSVSIVWADRLLETIPPKTLLHKISVFSTEDAEVIAPLLIAEAMRKRARGVHDLSEEFK